MNTNNNRNMNDDIRYRPLGNNENVQDYWDNQQYNQQLQDQQQYCYKLASKALFFGMLGLFCVFFAIPGYICGKKALKIDKRNTQARIGYILSTVCIMYALAVTITVIVSSI